VSGLFGKRLEESIKEGNSAPRNAQPPNVNISCCREFSYSTFGCREKSSLSFIRVKIVGRNYLALIDSGSSRTFLGPEIVELLRELQMPFGSPDGKRVTTATGQTTRIKGEINLAFKLKNRTRTLRACALPTLALSCIAGMDFLSAFGIGVNFATRRWFFVEDPRTDFEFEAGPGSSPLNVHAAIEYGGKSAQPLVTQRENFSRNESPPIGEGDRNVPDSPFKTTRKRAHIRSKRCRDRIVL